MNKANKGLEIWDLEKIVMKNAGLIKDKQLPASPKTHGDALNESRDADYQRTRQKIDSLDDDSDMAKRRKAQEEHNNKAQEDLERAGEEFVDKNKPTTKQSTLF